MPVETRRRFPASEPPGPQGRVVAAARPPGRDGDVSHFPADGSGKSKKKTKRRKDPLWARLVTVFGAVLMMSSGVAIVGAKAVISEATSTIEKKNLIDEAGKSDAEGGDSLEGPIDLLLLGVDYRVRNGKDDVRADTIIILHIPASHDQAYLISIPRDTELEVKPFEKSGFEGGMMKATDVFHAGSWNGAGWAGGTQLLSRTLMEVTGVKFDGAAIIDFGGFKKVIDALDGIPICVKQEVQSIHMELVDGKPKWKADARQMTGVKEPVIHKKGCREMQGWEALDYSRQRYGLDNGDYDRQQNQQQLIKGIAKKAMEQGVMTNPVKLRRLIQAAGEAFTLDLGNHEIADFLLSVRNVAANDLVLLRSNGGKFNPKFVNGEEREALAPITLEMFKALKEDRLGEFIINNPEVLAQSGN
jgi:LCP family protein required for cell wall assembly